jgi:hypothetical protein
MLTIIREALALEGMNESEAANGHALPSGGTGQTTRLSEEEPSTDPPEAMAAPDRGQHPIEVPDDGTGNFMDPDGEPGSAYEGWGPGTLWIPEENGDDPSPLDWSPESITSPPEGDPECQEAATGIQGRITRHRVIETDTSWTDVELLLPQVRRGRATYFGLEEEYLRGVAGLLAHGRATGAVFAVRRRQGCATSPFAHRNSVRQPDRVHAPGRRGRRAIS